MRVIAMNENPIVLFKEKALPYFNRKRIFIIMGILVFSAFIFAGQWLIVDQEPQKADVIFVLSGADGRVEEALTLVGEGFSDSIVLTNARGFSELEHARVKEQVASNNIYTDYESKSTLASAEYSKELMEKRNMSSALIVSSDYHMRRTKLNYERAFKGSDIELVYIGTESRYHALHWWSNKYSIGVTGSEYIKLIGNFVGIHGALAKKTLYEFDNYFFS